MGCDIHLYVEERLSDPGRWTSHDSWLKDEDGDVSVPYDLLWYSGRSYDLFAILASVRNGYGFAGVETGGGFIPISDPRGLPPDVSAEVAAVSDRWGADGHSHSHLSLRDLLEFDWTQVATKTGLMNAKEWLSWKATAPLPPQRYSGAVFGQEVRHVTPAEMDELLKINVAEVQHQDRLVLAEEHRRVYARGEWTETYAKAVDSAWWQTTVPRLLALAGTLDNADRVRIVFFFDN